MTTNNPSKYYPKSGGQFEPVGTGQFQPAKGGQLEPARGGQLQPDFATFGQIGGENNDNGNNWLYNTTDSSWLQNSTFKIWRFSNTQIFDYIKTDLNLLTSAESGSNNLFYKYPVQNTSIGFIDSCADPLFLISPVASGSGTLEVNGGNDGGDAEDVATNDDEYINFEEVAHWMNMQDLYELLDRSEDLRNGSSILNNFYNNYTNGAIGKLHDVELALASLFDFKGDDEELAFRYQEAIQRNQEIADEEDHISNERTIYDIAMRMAVKGMDSITQIQRMEIEILAKTCPFVGGNAVYLARTLWAMYNPLEQYNDKLLCIQGNNKNGNSYINLDSLYEAQTNEYANALVHKLEKQTPIKAQSILNADDSFEDIMIYPNPASDNIHISYSSEYNGEFILYNSLGESIAKEKLSKHLKTQQVNLNNIANGIYHYEIEFTNLKKAIGKITIIK